VRRGLGRTSVNALTPILTGLVKPGHDLFLVGLLDRVCEALEPTEPQHAEAKKRYETVGDWIADSEIPAFRTARIFPQGSFAIGTVIRPLREQEFDVDLVCHFPELQRSFQPGALKKLLGDRLRAHGTYASMLREMLRCWRINYANEFHLDITPSIQNRLCLMKGELVPDKAASNWKASNPLGFRDLFCKRAELRPRFLVLKSFDAAMAKRADVAPFPARTNLKGILRRIVQLSKRHRDIFFESRDPGVAPISVIITTLASQAYEYCVRTGVYDNEFHLLRAVVAAMPRFIECVEGRGRTLYIIANETTEGENFAEKWNTHPGRSEAFYLWHGQYVRDLDEFAGIDGMDRVQKSLATSFGSVPVNQAFASITSEVEAARRANSLHVAPSVGLVAPSKGSTIVRPNTFYGAD
jgi:hypothetical protein